MGMKNCKICGNAITENGIKIKYGMACSSCMSKLPRGVRKSAENFTALQLKELFKVAQPMPAGTYIWVRWDNFLVGDRYVILNSMKYELKDLEKVYLNFHPHDLGSEADTANGIISIVILLRQPHVLIEETVSEKEYSVKYHISGMNILYQFPGALDRVVKSINASISNGSYVIPEAVKYFDAAREKARQKEKKQDSKNTWNGEQTENMTPLEAAMKMFGLQRPFSKEELRRKRNQYITAYHIHPDDGGSGVAFQRVQESYDLLLKFATD